MRFRTSNMAEAASRESPERRSDGLASPEVKKVPGLPKNHLFESEILKITERTREEELWSCVQVLV
jgi:hypothetical protein